MILSLLPSVSARRRGLAVAVGVVVALAASAPASSASLPTRLTRALTAPGVSWHSTGAMVLDVQTGRLVYARNVNTSLQPASNEKLAVAVAAVDELGPRYGIFTRVLGDGSRVGRVWRGRLVLKGYGDPTLRRADLVTLAWRVRALGIRYVTGTVVGDESYFDRRRTVVGWKPSYYKRETPPLSALVVDRGRVAGRVVDDPALAAAQAFRRALWAAGVRVMGRATKGVARATATPLARTVSPRVAGLILLMNRPSDNFIAESLLKHLGRRELGVGSTYAGARVVPRVLRARGVPLAGVRIVDGSGLSVYNRLTARAIAVLLRSVWRDTDVRYPFVYSLPLAGVNGTLRDRLRSLPARGNVRAKTGTTDRSSALSGYVRTRYVFSIVQNGRPIALYSARAAQDRFVQVLAGA